MAYPTDFIKVTFGGSVYDGADIWSCGINFGLLGGGSITTNQAEIDAAAQAVQGSVKLWFEGEDAHISQYAQLEWVKVAIIGKDGLYKYDAGLYDYEEGVVGYENNYVAPQLSVALTMESTKRRAPGRFARIYPPLNVPSTLDDGRVPEAWCTDMAQSFSLLIGGISDGLGASFSAATTAVPIVASQKTPEHNRVVTVKVGNVIDTQRSRRNQIAEVYTTPVAIPM